MAQLQIHTTCDDCIKIFKDAASLLSSKSEEEKSSVILFHPSYQSRLKANMSSSTCHMCTLLGASIPRLLESFDSKEVLGLAISRARHDPAAANVILVGCETDALNIQTHYTGSLQIQDSEKKTKIHKHGIQKSDGSS
jgi:hypothetical protein